MLGLFEEEGGEVHLLFQSPLAADGQQQGQQVGGDGFLAGLEERRQMQEDLPLQRREALPVGLILAEVQGAGVPDAKRLAFSKRRMGGGVAPETGGCGDKGVMLGGHWGGRCR